MAKQYPAIAQSQRSHPFDISPQRVAQSAMLREPQREAFLALAEFWKKSTAPALVQMPVGCGKTGLMAILPFGHCRSRTLLVAPNVAIRDHIQAAVEAGSKACFWERAKILPPETRPPFCATLDGPDVALSDCDGSQYVVANIQQLVACRDRWLRRLAPDYFDLILIDEGHHNPAQSWRKVLQRFSAARVVSLTATPFRSDGQSVIGHRVYQYTFTRAMQRGYIKRLLPLSVVPTQIYFTYRDDTRLHTLEEVLRLREEAWFRRGVALAPKCNWDIVRASAQKLLQLRHATQYRHQLIATTCSIDHAEQVRTLYERLGLRAAQLHSLLPPHERDRVLDALARGALDCIVQVEMLGEGFDHPPLSVAAIFRPFASLSPYVQFVGRIMRVVREGLPEHPDNQGWVVSHAGLHVDRHWDDFRQLDAADEALFRKLVAGSNAPRQMTLDGTGAGPQAARRRARRSTAEAARARRAYSPPPSALAARALTEATIDPLPLVRRPESSAATGARRPRRAEPFDMEHKAKGNDPRSLLGERIAKPPPPLDRSRPSPKPAAVKRRSHPGRKSPTGRDLAGLTTGADGERSSSALPEATARVASTGGGLYATRQPSAGPRAADVLGPQQKRRMLRRSLQLACRGAVAELLAELKLNPRGWQLFRLVRGVGPGSNYVTASKLIHQRLNERLGLAAGEKSKADLQMTAQALLLLDGVMEELVSQLSRNRGGEP